MKIHRNGQAEILTRAQLVELFAVLSPKYKLLFGICYYTGCRISEALQLQRSDVGKENIVFRRATTKTKLTREVAIASGSRGTAGSGRVTGAGLSVPWQKSRELHDLSGGRLRAEKGV
jgi:integrase